MYAFDNGTVEEQKKKKNKRKGIRTPWFGEKIKKFGKLSMEGFEKKFKDLDVGLGLSMEESYRVWARDCFNFGECRKRGKRTSAIRPANDIDLAQTCPDQQRGSAWNFREDRDVRIGRGQVIILDKEWLEISSFNIPILTSMMLQFLARSSPRGVKF